ncbi:MAG: hypothetical protein HQK49_08910 [Oligoflexia bacterium]|nr:hypothetical protein [Oligoflexia bacterium]
MKILKDNIHGCLLRAYIYLSHNIKNKNKNKTCIIHGTLNQDTHILIQSWLLNNKDIENHLLNNHDYVWRDFADKIKKQNKNLQYIIFPLFSPTEEELLLLKKNNRIVVNLHTSFSFILFLTLLAKHTVAVIKSFFYLKRLDYFIAYIASIFNPRFIMSILIYKQFKTMIKKTYVVLLPWENHPEQKAICAAFREGGSTVYGYTHAGTNSVISLNKVENKIYENAYPEKLFIHSRDIFKASSYVGWKKEHLVYIKSQRFLARSPNDFLGKVFLPYSVDGSLWFLKKIKKMINDGKICVKEIKIHPSFVHNEDIKALIKEISFDDKATNVIIYGFTTVVLEALESGCSVVQYVENSVGIVDEITFPSIKKEEIADGVYRLSLHEGKKGNLVNYHEGKELIDYICF